ncbi:MAG: hypothetical protein ACN6O5_15150 [Achromobacter sp.]|uniref:non-homologous end-joining DNA ligase LigD n=1 Tax=Achromobacter sp. TaxID=134375 RepID=UPI003CFED23E
MSEQRKAGDHSEERMALALSHRGRTHFGATTAAAWSARARSGLGVSVPLSWDELGDVTGGAQWTISNIQNRLDVANSPWDDYTPQTISKAMNAIGYSPERTKG